MELKLRPRHFLRLRWALLRALDFELEHYRCNKVEEKINAGFFYFFPLSPRRNSEGGSCEGFNLFEVHHLHRASFSDDSYVLGQYLRSHQSAVILDTLFL